MTALMISPEELEKRRREFFASGKERVNAGYCAWTGILGRVGPVGAATTDRPESRLGKRVYICAVMRTSIPLLAVFIASLLLLVSGCAAQKGETPDDEAPPAITATQSETGTRTTTFNIVNSAGERVEVEAEIADDDAERQMGLMGRTELAENAGMLFVYENEHSHKLF